MSIALVRTLPEDAWGSFVGKHPEGNIFHTPEMFRVFNRTKNYRPELWAAIRGSRILALFLPVQTTLMSGLFRPFTSRFVAHGSVLCEPDGEGLEALDKLLESYTHQMKGPPLFTELRNLTKLETVQPILSKHGFVYEDHLNYLINLNRSPEAVFKDFGRRTRKNIRRGIKQGRVVIQEAKEMEQVTACYGLIRRTYHVAHVPLADRSLFEAAFDVLRPKDMVRFTLACVDQEPVACSVELLYKGTIIGWYGGMNRAYGGYVSNELLMWHILKWGSEKGYRLYDFGGAGSPDEEYGVRDFKAKFGGELVSFGRNVYVHAPLLLRLSKIGYKVLGRFF
jgi:lipid II:glycine glycyltransferase (peptidoglycan interpeptide bridge formation enzyme)